MLNKIDKYFQISQSGGRIRTEIFGGFTTFMTMSYIVFVNPDIMAPSGMPAEAVMVATCLASAVSTFIMGVLANYPIGLAPSMGVNVFFTFGLVLGMGFTWQVAMASVFIEGIIFIILTLTNARDKILDSIPYSLKLGIPAGIGLFLMFIGMQKCGFVVANKDTLVTVGNLTDIKVLLGLFGLILMTVLYIFNVKGSILIGIFAVTILSVFAGLTPWPEKIVSMPPSISPIFMQMDFSRIFDMNFIIITLVLVFMDIFNTVGTLIGVATRAGLADEKGTLKRAKGAFMSDAVGTSVGAVMGVTTVTAYVESVTGVEAGGRTGLVAVVIAILFLLAVFFSPLVAVIPSYATAPALILVGVLMLSVIKQLDISDWTEFFPAMIAMTVMPFTYNIATGIEFGMLSYVFLKLLTGRIKEVSAVMLVLAAIFIIKEIVVVV